MIMRLALDGKYRSTIIRLENDPIDDVTNALLSSLVVTQDRERARR